MIQKAQLVGYWKTKGLLRARYGNRYEILAFFGRIIDEMKD